MDNKKVFWVVAAILILLMIIASPVMSEETHSVGEESRYIGEDLTNADFIRLHVVANSDSEEDQDLKLEVRNAVLELMSRDANKSGRTNSVRETAAYINENLDIIKSTAEGVIERNCRSYEVNAKLGISWIPEKEYENVIFPAGNYRALTITIGAGQGQNWWCVIFPPLCLIGADTEIAGPLAEKYDVITEHYDEPVKLKLKFKSAEVLEKIME